MKNQTYPLLFFFLFLFGTSFSQEVGNIVYELDHSYCEGQLILKKKKNKAELYIYGLCDYMSRFKGVFKMGRGDTVRITIDKKYTKYYGKEYIINDSCFVWDEFYTFCKEK